MSSKLVDPVRGYLLRMEKGIRLCGGVIWVLEKGISPLSPKILRSLGVLANAAIEQLTEDRI